jgi:hypothetical protein
MIELGKVPNLNFQVKGIHTYIIKKERERERESLFQEILF